MLTRFEGLHKPLTHYFEINWLVCYIHVGFCLGHTPNNLILCTCTSTINWVVQDTSQIQDWPMQGCILGQLATLPPELPHTLSSYNGTYLSGGWFGVICSVHFYANPPKPYKDVWGKHPSDLIPVQANCDNNIYGTEWNTTEASLQDISFFLWHHHIHLAYSREFPSQCWFYWH